MKAYLKHIGVDLSASVVVFLVALPLCLGIAVGSGAPVFSGIIAGVVGGVLVGFLSGSPLSVSGPAAGLTAIVSGAIGQLPAYDVFLVSVVLAGVLQVILGRLKAGVLGNYIPNSVIKGMLAAIGVILILKQLPHLVGFDNDFEGDEAFVQPDHSNTLTELWQAFRFFSPTATCLGLVSLAIQLCWMTPWAKKRPLLKQVPAPLVAVLVTVGIHEYLRAAYPDLALLPKHLVALPVATSFADFTSFFVFPQWSALDNPVVWTTAITLAVVASLETLLGIEAIDKLDPNKRVTPTNRELMAQGGGNIVSGLLGGIPVTSVVVRSSANVNAGAQTKISTIAHGVLLFVSVLLVPQYLNHIPIASLAAVLILTGYKLVSLPIIRTFFKKGWDQFVPFGVTIVAILFTDLLVGIVVGIVVGLFFLIRSNFRSSILVANDKNNYLIRLRKDVSFLNKPIIKAKMESLPNGCYVLIDATRADFIDKDIIEEINGFIQHAPTRGIQVEIKKSLHKPMHLLFHQTPVIHD